MASPAPAPGKAYSALPADDSGEDAAAQGARALAPEPGELEAVPAAHQRGRACRPPDEADEADEASPGAGESARDGLLESLGVPGCGQGWEDCGLGAGGGQLPVASWLAPVAPWLAGRPRLQFAGGLLAGALLAFSVVTSAGLCRLWQDRGDADHPMSLRAPLRGALLNPATAADDAVARDLTFLTAETRGKSLLEAAGDFAAGFGAPVVNAGLGKEWISFKTKVEILHDYVFGVKRERERQGKSSKDHFVAIFDGKDVFWGGCSPADFMGAYKRIARASGASIVFGAEIVCGEQDCNRVPRVPLWASNLAGGRDLEGGFWETYNEGCHGTWTDECAAKRDCGFSAPCAEPPSVKFLNSGFFMGPVDELAAMLEWSLVNFDNTSVYGDQSVFSKWWELNPDKLALDYLGELSLQLSDLDWRLLTADKRTGVVWNNGFDRVQCLVHGNGRGSFFAAHVLRRLTGGFDQRDLRGWGSDSEPN